MSITLTAICLSPNTLTLIKWKDEEGKTQSFHLVTKVNEKWRRTGKLLDYTNTELDDMEREQKGNTELCWCLLMEKWLFTIGCQSYPANLDGLYSLLLGSKVPYTTLEKQ